MSFLLSCFYWPVLSNKKAKGQQKKGFWKELCTTLNVKAGDFKSKKGHCRLLFQQKVYLPLIMNTQRFGHCVLSGSSAMQFSFAATESLTLGQFSWANTKWISLIYCHIWIVKIFCPSEFFQEVQQSVSHCFGLLRSYLSVLYFFPLNTLEDMLWSQMTHRLGPRKINMILLCVTGCTVALCLVWRQYSLHKSYRRL